MKLAQIILPERAPDGVANRALHQDLRHMLLELWGFYSDAAGVIQAAGGKRLPVMTYSVPMDRADVIRLRQAVQVIAYRGGFEDIMIVTPCGDVERIKPLDHNREVA